MPDLNASTLTGKAVYCGLFCLLLLSVTACSTALEPLAATPATAQANGQTNSQTDEAALTPIEQDNGESTASEANSPEPNSSEPSNNGTATEEASTDDPAAGNASDSDSTDTNSTPEPTATAPDNMPSTDKTATIALDGSCDTQSEILTNTMKALFNEVRRTGQQCGNQFYPATDPLSVSDTLTGVANQHSADMAEKNFFSHTGSDGLSASNRVDNSGYNWSAVGENIAAGQSTIESAVNGWIKSPGHCANIMSDNFSEFGAACVQDSGSDYGVYWTAVYGRTF